MHTLLVLRPLLVCTVIVLNTISVHTPVPALCRSVTTQAGRDVPIAIGRYYLPGSRARDHVASNADDLPLPLTYRRNGLESIKLYA